MDSAAFAIVRGVSTDGAVDDCEGGSLIIDSAAGFVGCVSSNGAVGDRGNITSASLGARTKVRPKIDSTAGVARRVSSNGAIGNVVDVR